jgi:hypothetical protein
MLTSTQFQSWFKTWTKTILLFFYNWAKTILFYFFLLNYTRKSRSYKYCLVKNDFFFCHDNLIIGCVYLFYIITSCMHLFKHEDEWKAWFALTISLLLLLCFIKYKKCFHLQMFHSVLWSKYNLMRMYAIWIPSKDIQGWVGKRTKYPNPNDPQVKPQWLSSDQKTQQKVLLAS